MPRNARIPEIDQTPRMLLIAKLLQEEAAERSSSDASFHELSAAQHSIMADVMWLAEDERLKNVVSEEQYLVVDGVHYKRLEQESSAIYFGLWGGHLIHEHLYRVEGVRNGPTIKPLERRLGIIEGRFLPSLASAAGAMLTCMPDRQVEKFLVRLGFRPPSRATIAKGLGAMLTSIAADVKAVDERAREMESFDFEVGMVSCGIDRFAARMDEELPPGPRRDAKLHEREGRNYKRTPPEPYERNWRMAWAGNMTVYDREGIPRSTLWYGASADADPGDLADRIGEDVVNIIERHSEVKVAVVVDGAPEVGILRSRLAARTACEPALRHVVIEDITDFYHAAGDAKAVADALDSPKQTREASERYRATLRHVDDGVGQLIDEFRSLQEQCPNDKLEGALHDAIVYFDNRRAKMEYARLRADGYVIGSGATESTCGLMQLRVKHPGSHWSSDGVHGVLVGRGLWLSERWDAAIALQSEAASGEIRLAA